MISKEERAEICRQNGKKQLGQIPINARFKEGGTVGNLTLKKRLTAVGHRKNSVLWSCTCLCGNPEEIVRTSNQLSRKDSMLHCGCLKAKHSHNFSGYEGISGSFMYRAKRAASQRDLEFAITIQDIWELYQSQGGVCALSGVEISFDHGSASIDRVDSTRGYFKDNIQMVHKDVNRMKVDYPQDYFIHICKSVAAKHYGLQL